MLNRREFMFQLGYGAVMLSAYGASVSGKDQQGRGGCPNILFMSADDMSYSSLGCTGCKLSGISPSLDRLAHQGLLLDHCHIVTPICGPSRHAWITGALPHQSGFMGHDKMPPLWFGPSPIICRDVAAKATEGL